MTFAQRLAKAVLATFAILSISLTALAPTMVFAQTISQSVAQSISQVAPSASQFVPARSQHVVRAPTGRSIYFEVWRGQPGQPVYATLNGLLFKQSYWDPFLFELTRRGATIVRIAFSADPESLLTPSVNGAQPFSLDGLVSEISAVLDVLSLQRVTLLPLSFGSISTHFAAAHPERVERIILLAPMIVPMDNYDEQGAMARAWLENVRLVWGDIAYEYYWTALMEPTVRSLVQRRIRAMDGYLPLRLQEDVAIAGALEKIRATRHFDLRNYTQVRLPRIDLILAEGEQAGIFRDQLDFWNNLSTQSKGSFVLIRQASHALVADAPLGTANALDVIRATNGSPQAPFVRLDISKDGAILNQDVRR